MLDRLFYSSLEAAKQGRVFWLNAVFKRILPFNAPHGIRVLSLSDEQVRVALPDRRVNRNHLKGTHACAIATACEFCSGLAVLAQFDMKNYRLIMNRLEVDYMRRPVKGACVAKADISPNLREEVQQLISESADSAARFVMPSVLLDASGNEVARASVHWHVKAWNDVKYKPTA
jgi:acyl-coenzyme A thioesterase PaaI-like protein